MKSLRESNLKLSKIVKLEIIQTCFNTKMGFCCDLIDMWPNLKHLVIIIDDRKENLDTLPNSIIFASDNLEILTLRNLDHNLSILNPNPVMVSSSIPKLKQLNLKIHCSPNSKGFMLTQNHPVPIETLYYVPTSPLKYCDFKLTKTLILDNHTSATVSKTKEYFIINQEIFPSLQNLKIIGRPTLQGIQPDCFYEFQFVKGFQLTNFELDAKFIPKNHDFKLLSFAFQLDFESLSIFKIQNFNILNHIHSDEITKFVLNPKSLKRQKLGS